MIPRSSACSVGDATAPTVAGAACRHARRCTGEGWAGLGGGGGTAEAAALLLERIGARILQVGFLIELTFLHGRNRLGKFPVKAQVVY